MFVSIKFFLNKFSKRPDISLKIQEQSVKASWESIVENVHKSARGKSRALYVKPNGELVVQVANHLWLQELTFFKKELEKRISDKNKDIKSIRLIT